MDTSRQPGLRINELFLVQARFSHAPDFLSRDRRNALDETNIEADFKVGLLDDRTAAVAVEVKTVPDGDSAYQFDVEIMAIVSADEETTNLPPLEYVRLAGVTMLFPFIREAVANLTMRGRFGAVWIRPFNVKSALQVAERRTEPRAKATRRTKAD